MSKVTTRNKKSHKPMNHDSWEMLKTLSSTNLSLNQMASISGYGASTISRVKATKNYEEYRQLVTSYKTPQVKILNNSKQNSNKPQLTKEAEQKPKEDNKAPLTFEQIQLGRIASALERLATAWENPKVNYKKKSLFGGK